MIRESLGPGESIAPRLQAREHYVKQPNGGWLLTEAKRFEDVLDLPSIGCTLALRDVYDRVIQPAQ